MIIERKKISEITPADYNPRQVTPEKRALLRKSIARFGLVEPLVWNKRTQTLVSGAQRLSVLIEDNAESVDVVVVDLSPTDEKALNLQLNNHAGTWDPSKLDAVIQELEDYQYDMDLTGFGIPDATDTIEALPDAPEAKGLPVAETSKAKQKTVPLYFLTEEDKTAFFVDVDKLAKIYNTPDVTETVRKALRESAKGFM